MITIYGQQDFNVLWFLPVGLLYALFLILLPCLICGFICKTVMKKKKYVNYKSWFFAGLFFNIIGVAICLVMPDSQSRSGFNQPFKPTPNFNQYPNQPPYPNGQYQPPQQETYQPPYQSSYQDVPYDVPYDDGSIEQVQCAVCPSCGMINPPSSATCSSCGSKL